MITNDGSKNTQYQSDSFVFMSHTKAIVILPNQLQWMLRLDEWAVSHDNDNATDRD
jgi:hypothetical protein